VASRQCLPRGGQIRKTENEMKKENSRRFKLDKKKQPKLKKYKSKRKLELPERA